MNSSSWTFVFRAVNEKKEKKRHSSRLVRTKCLFLAFFKRNPTTFFFLSSHCSSNSRPDAHILSIPPLPDWGKQHGKKKYFYSAIFLFI